MAKTVEKAKEKEVLPDNTTQSEEPKKSRFGVTAETKSKNLTPFQPTDEMPITLGYLVNVKSETREIKKTSEQKPVLVFEFKDIEKVRTHFHVEWPIDEGDKDEEVKMNGMMARIKHIYEEFQVLPVEGFGTDAEGFKEFFDAVVEAFNTGGKDGSPIYTNVPVWIKLSYNLKSGAKAQLGFPLSPNFIERRKEGKRSTLSINKKYETLKQPEGMSSRSPMPTDLGNPGAVEADFPDFPKA